MAQLHVLIKEIEELLERRTRCNEPEEEEKLLNLAIDRLQFALAIYPDDPELNYMMGLCWYKIGDSSRERDDKVEFYLKKCLNIDPRHQFANMFLGYFFYDSRRHVEALKVFENVDRSFFDELGQNWRNLKASELALCCSLKVELEKVSDANFHALVADYLSAEIIDRIAPTQLVESVCELCSDDIFSSADKGKISGFACIVLELLDKIEKEDLFSDNLIKLKSCCGKR